VEPTYVILEDELPLLVSIPLTLLRYVVFDRDVGAMNWVVPLGFVHVCTIWPQQEDDVGIVFNISRILQVVEG
jgi:hypothetical protein